MKVMFLISFVCSFYSTSFCSDIFRSEPWYKYAKEYIDYDEKLITDEIKNKQTFLKNFSLRGDAEERLLSSKSPSNLILSQLIVSHHAADRGIAIVNIMLRGIYDRDLFRKILSGIRSEDDFFIRFYSYHCFNSLDNDKINYFKSELLNALINESNESLIVTAMPSLTKIDSPKVVDLFVKYITEGSDGLKRAAIVNLKNVDEKYLEEIERTVNIEEAIMSLEKQQSEEGAGSP